ncbi:sensor domain-containing diguanylate cyclase [Bordetella genomosp. 5]|uniref:sensor domain-containing diguanylate cyclase n=1 Tax=Bordetella genomosp. 5 TaxID=1395608 RepID=UPI001C3E1479|nr:sensor domain-containing diguanylate cyclase [Bordetella genomosp. 5]
MRLKQLFRVDLLRLILALAVGSALLTLANGLQASYRLQRDVVLEATLEANRSYAAKLADNTHQFLTTAQQRLAYSAGLLADQTGHADRLYNEVSRLRDAQQSFNSTVVVDADGRVLAAMPENIGQRLVGTVLDTTGSRGALSSQAPLISKPYVSAAGNLMIHISYPIRGGNGAYQGYVAGTIYLQQNSALQTLLGVHYYRDGSYLYVVDQERRILYHAQRDRIGEVVGGNLAIDAVLRGESGAQNVINSRGVPMLAGYAPVGASGWGVVSQRPVDAALASMGSIMGRMTVYLLPLTLVALGLIWWLAYLISKPLRDLAHAVQAAEAPDVPKQVKGVRAWYFEVHQLRRAALTALTVLHERIGSLNQVTLTDPLTGLLNRRGLQARLKQWQSERRAFSVLAIDTDCFKRINDTLGHAEGDEVLRRIARVMTQQVRGGDICCRTGGEEFLILLPDTGLAEACHLAERLRMAVAAHASGAGQVTVSIGVAHCDGMPEAQGQALRCADAALYRAKQLGRNRTECAPTAEDAAAIH